MDPVLNKRGILMLGVGVLLGVIGTLLAAWVFDFPRRTDGSWNETPYQAVLLTSGEAYYGKLHNLSSRYPVLSDVHYIRRETIAQEGKPKFVLIKRGKEWHRPSHMLINAYHILFIEPVHPDSDVAKSIAAMQNQ